MFFEDHPELADPERFWTWVQAHGPMDMLGAPQQGEMCLIRNYLVEQSEDTHLWIGDTTLRQGFLTEQEPLPEWMTEVIQIFDDIVSAEATTAQFTVLWNAAHPERILPLPWPESVVSIGQGHDWEVRHTASCICGLCDATQHSYGCQIRLIPPPSAKTEEAPASLFLMVVYGPTKAKAHRHAHSYAKQQGWTSLADDD